MRVIELVFYNSDTNLKIVVPLEQLSLLHKLVVNENSFDWYLHFLGDDGTPKTCNVEGDKKAHKIELLGASYAPALVEGCSGCNRR